MSANDQSDGTGAARPASNRNKQRKDDYEVGFKRPPKRFQFQPGNNANPKGRPRGAKNKKLVISELLFESIQVTQGNESKKMPKLGVIVQKLLNKALQGDMKATSEVLKLADKHDLLTPRDDQPNPHDLSDNDKEILKEYIRRQDLN